MSAFCSQGGEIAEALRSGRWPHGCDPQLRAHVDACRSCNDLVLVTQAFQKARSDSAQAARLGAPGLLWWKAQLRRRNAAVEQVSKPITVAQIFALLLNLLVAWSLLASLFPHGLKPALMWSGLLHFDAFHWETLWSFPFMKLDGTFMLLIPSLGALVLLSGVVLYLTSEQR
jgi:hypothetical protein